MQAPLSMSHSRMVVSKDAVTSICGWLGLADPGPEVPQSVQLLVDQNGDGGGSTAAGRQIAAGWRQQRTCRGHSRLPAAHVDAARHRLRPRLNDCPGEM